MRLRAFEWVDDRLVLETDEALAPVEEDELMAELAFTIAQVVVPEGVPELTAFYLGFGARSLASASGASALTAASAKAAPSGVRRPNERWLHRV